jgi:hypothetical protein
MGKRVRTLRQLTVDEFEEVLKRTVETCFEVWFTPLMDALVGVSGANGDEFRPEFAASLRRSLEQAKSGVGTPLETFRSKLGR